MTLLTDFGDRDGYVGVMKGVVVSICPSVQLIDLSHEVPPQDVAAARFILLNAYGYFPASTVHLVVVDPGVGTARQAIALQTAHGIFVGPDNGVLSGVLERCPVITAVALTNPQYWRSPHPSRTFHGRDIFAAAAAHLAAGINLSALGTVIEPESLVQLEIPPLQRQSDRIVGTVQYIDHFGNAVTTIPAAAVQSRVWRCRVGDNEIPMQQTYGEVESRQAIALIGSHGWLEVAVNGGSAQAQLQLAIGDEIQLLSQT